MVVCYLPCCTYHKGYVRTKMVNMINSRQRRLIDRCIRMDGLKLLVSDDVMTSIVLVLLNLVGWFAPSGTPSLV